MKNLVTPYDIKRSKQALFHSHFNIEFAHFMSTTPMHLETQPRLSSASVTLKILQGKCCHPLDTVRRSKIYWIRVTLEQISVMVVVLPRNCLIIHQGVLKTLVVRYQTAKPMKVSNMWQAKSS